MGIWAATSAAAAKTSVVERILVLEYGACVVFDIKSTREEQINSYDFGVFSGE